MFTDKELMELGLAVVVMATEIFEECGNPADVCIQHNALDTVIFGGSNRVILSPHGWSASEMHCSDNFMRLFKEKYHYERKG